MGTVTSAFPSGAVSEGPANLVGPNGANSVLVFDITLSSSYATGGDSFALPADAGPGELVALMLCQPADGTYTYAWDGSTSDPKILVFDAFATEESAATDLSGVTLRAVAIVK